MKYWTVIFVFLLLFTACRPTDVTPSYESLWEYAPRSEWEATLDTLFQPEDWSVEEGWLRCDSQRIGLSSLHLSSENLPSQRVKQNRLTLKVRIVIEGSDTIKDLPYGGFILGAVRDGDPEEEDFLNDWEQGIVAGLDGLGRPAFWYAKGDFMRGQPLERGFEDCPWQPGDEVELLLQVFGKGDHSLVLTATNLTRRCARVSAMHNISHRHLTGKGNIGLIASQYVKFRDWKVYIDWVAPD